GVDAPQPGRAVEHAAAVVGRVMRALGADDQARRLLILAVRRERHPECFEIVGREPCAHVDACRIRVAHATRVTASVRLASKMSMPSRTSWSLAVSGTRKRITFPYVPQERRIS